MNKLDVSQLLTIQSVVDNRKVAESTTEEWFNIIGHLDYDQALEAMRLHNAESEKYMMPVHVIANVKRIRDSATKHRSVSPINEIHYPVPKNLDAWSKGHGSPQEFAKQEAIYHQQCRDEGFNPHAITPYMRRDYVCYSCIGDSPEENVDLATGVVG